MDRHESSALKGIAILFLLFLHLFNDYEDVGKLGNIIYISGVPLVKYIARATSAVYIFLIISGYGLYKSYEGSRLTLRSNLKRVAKTYIHYWIICGLFVVIGILLAVPGYPGDWKCFMGNVTAWSTSYNFVAWFLFPYCVAMLLSPVWCGLLDRYPKVSSGIALVIGYGAVAFILKVVQPNGWHQIQYVENPVSAFNFIMVMTIGAAMAKFRVFERVKNFFHSRQMVLWMLVLAVFAGRMLTSSAVFHREYIIIFVPLVMALRLPGAVTGFLVAMGRRSATMWLSHTFFCHYIFSDFVYGFKYPVLIFAVLVALSFGTAVVLDPVVARVRSFIFERKDAVAVSR